MADNVTFQSGELATPPAGTQVSADEAASGLVQRVKLTYSADGSDTPVTADASGLLVSLGIHKDHVGDPMADTDDAVAVKSAIFGHTTGGGGGWFPVKVTPSGALTVETDLGGVVSGSNLLVQDSGLSLPISSSAAEVYSISDQATSATLLNANALRKGWAIFNDSTAALYLKFGATASATDFSVKLVAGAHYEQMGHGVYTGRVDGIWASDASGAARCTEW